MGCCLPLGFAAALGTAGASTLFAALRPWLLGISVVLLGVGFWQQRTAKRCAAKRIDLRGPRSEGQACRRRPFGGGSDCVCGVPLGGIRSATRARAAPNAYRE